MDGETAPQIPDDIKAQVDIVMREIPGIWYPGDDERVSDVIGLAILVERERCAGIARGLNGWGARTDPAGLAEHIAKVILGRG